MSAKLAAQIRCLEASVRNAMDTELVSLPDVCALVDGVPAYITPIIRYVDGVAESTTYSDEMGNPITGVVEAADPCDCDCIECPDVLNAFDVTNVDRTADTKFNLDDPTFSNAYGVIGTANWTAADLVAALNATAAGAVGPTVPSGIDYSTTVWANSGDLVYVDSGPIPTTLDLVSISVSLPISATV